MTPGELVEAVARAMREDWRNRMSAEDRAETLPWEDIEAEERADCIAMAPAALARMIAAAEARGMLKAAGIADEYPNEHGAEPFTARGIAAAIRAATKEIGP